MPVLIPINETTYKINIGRDEAELGDINASQCLAHVKHKRCHHNYYSTLSHPGTPTGLVMIDVPNGIIRIPYGNETVELTAHDPNNDYPDGRAEFNIILNSQPTPDVNGEYWQVLNFETNGFNVNRILGLDEEWSQPDCYDHWYNDLYDNHQGNNLYGHDNGTGVFVRTPTEIRTPDGEVVIKSKPEHLVHSLQGKAIQNNRYTSELGEIKAGPRKGKQLKYTRVSRDYLTLPRRELIDDRGNRARIEDIQIDGSQIKFKLPKDFIEAGRTKYPIKHTIGLDPAYTEAMDVIDGTGFTEGAWTAYDIEGTDGYTSDMVLEFIITNGDAGKQYYGGVRTYGSSLERRIELHEAEGGGVTTVRMFVQPTDNAGSGNIEYYSQENTDIVFTVPGYWENVDFTETWDSISSLSTGWQESQLADSGAANKVNHVILGTFTEAARTVGCRATDSALNRYIMVHEAEGDGYSVIDMFVKADADYTVDVYTDTVAFSLHVSEGYFSSEMDFTGFLQALTVSSDSWETKDLTAYLDQDGRVVDVLLLNHNTGSTNILGARDGDDSTTERSFEEHEAEDNGGATGEETGFGISAKSNSSGEIKVKATQYAHETIKLMGYFKPAAAGPQNISSAGAIASLEAFGSHVVAGPISSVGNIASAEAFGTQKLNFGLTATAIATAETIGSHKLNFTVSPVAIISAEAFGTPQLNLQIRPVGIASAEALGTAILGQVLSPSGVTSLEAFGTPKINLAVSPTGIASAEAFGTTVLTLYLATSAIASAEAFGTPKLNFTLLPSDIASAETIGSHKVNFTLTPAGIASAEAIGSHKLNFILAPVGIATAETFGTPSLSLVLTISPTGIVSAEAFGTTTVSLVAVAFVPWAVII